MSVIKADKQPQSDANSVQMQFKRQNCEDATQAKPVSAITIYYFRPIVLV